jgi:hypothetical protein
MWHILTVGTQNYIHENSKERLYPGSPYYYLIFRLLASYVYKKFWKESPTVRARTCFWILHCSSAMGFNNETHCFTVADFCIAQQRLPNLTLDSPWLPGAGFALISEILIFAILK